MANLHSSFLEFNGTIRLNDQKRDLLILSRDRLRELISRQFSGAKTKLNEEATRILFTENLEFQSQGSFVMDTIISSIHNDYDLDDGVYLVGQRSRDERPTPDELHQLVKLAIGNGDTSVKEVISKKTCIRVIYYDGFHIDLPIYYAGDKRCPDLAHRDKGYILSNPVEFIAWFEDKISSGFKKEYLYEGLRFQKEYHQWLADARKADHQLRRIVRYLKAWGDLRREDMPCGLIMTILAANHYYPHDRDDISLKETLVKIYSALSRDFRCERPTTPKGEDLLEGYPHKHAFLRYLQTFIDCATKALQETDARKACGFWQDRLGNRFPCQNIPTGHNHSNAAKFLGLIAGAAGNKPWA